MVAAKVGPVSARFTGQITLADLNPPTSYTLKFEGQGGAAGFANGEAKVALAPAEGGGTALTYTAKAQVGGKLAQIGSRLIDGAAAKTGRRILRAIRERVAPAAQVPGAPEPKRSACRSIGIRATSRWWRSSRSSRGWRSRVSRGDARKGANHGQRRS